MLSTSDLYYFKMALFDNGKPEDFLLFVRNFNKTLVLSGKLKTGAEVQYLCNLFYEEELRQFDSLSAVVEIMQTLDVDQIIKGLAHYSPSVNSLFKKKRTMRCGMKKTCDLTVRCYAERLIDLNEYLASFMGTTLTD